MKNKKEMIDLEKTPLPSIGWKIKRISESPRIKIGGWKFIGTWQHLPDGYLLTEIRWQYKDGEIVSNECFHSLVVPQ